MNRPHILLVEDEANIARRCCSTLTLKVTASPRHHRGGSVGRFTDERCDLVIS